MENNKNKEENIHNNETINVSEDKIKLTLIKYTDIVRSESRLWTWIGFLISFVTTLVTSDFKNVLGVDSSLIRALFVVLSMLCAAMSMKEAIKLIIAKHKGIGGEEWFLLEIQGKKKAPKSLVKSNVLNGKKIFGKCLQVLIYASPIILWLIVMFFIKWENAWSRTFTEEWGYPWMASLFLSIGWFVLTYLTLIVYMEIINDWFDEVFYSR